MERISWKEINRLAIPAIISGIAEPIIAVVDTAIIGRLGVSELGGVGIASSFFLLVVWILAQTKSAISALVSQKLGQGSLESLRTFVPQAVFLNLSLGLLFFFVTRPFSEQVFMLYQAEGDVLRQATDYFNIRALGFPVTLATMAIFGALRGLQNTSWAMQISLIGGAVNLILDFILVFGVGNLIPAFGVKGAAMASLIAQVTMFVLAVVTLVRKTPFSIYISFKPSPFLRDLFRMSSDLFIRTILLNLAYYLGNRFATGYGPETIAAHSIAMNIWLFSAFFIDGYANAGNAIAGKLNGAGQLAEIGRVGIRLLLMNLGITVLLTLVYLSGYSITPGLFTSDPATIALLLSMYWLVLICQPINGVAFTFDGIYKGLGRTALLRNTLIASTLIGFVPSILISDWLDGGLLGIWWAFLIWMLFRGGILFIHFIRHYPVIGKQ